MKRDSLSDGPGPIELVEEAVHLLRRAPASVLALYGVGTLPFMLAFLYFWAEMSHGAFARDHAATGALGLALVFLWMKCWQAAFAVELRARITGRVALPYSLKRIARMAIAQTALQPIGLFVLPLASVIVLPFGWLYGYFQNVTVLADGSAGISQASKMAAAQASWRVGRSYAVLAALSFFAFIVWLNVAIFMAIFPGLLKTFLGIDNAYTQAGALNVLNTTYLACTVVIAYICVDPLVKTVYALRCFYGQSRQSGEDLIAALPSAGPRAMPLVLLAICLATSISAAPVEGSVSPAQLNQSIDEVQKEAQYAWRMPREEPDASDDSQSNWIVRALRAGAQGVVDGLKWVGHNVAETMRWIGREVQKLWPSEAPTESSMSSNFSWAPILQVFLLVLILGMAAFVAILIFRLPRRRRKRWVVAAEVAQAKPDLNDENIAADQFSEEGWLAMGRELMAQGELRLALRAFYLAGLAHLAAREFISIGIFKSNREYETELRRRARANSETLSAFSGNVAIFDRVWYGLHNVTTETLQEFEVNLQQIRAC